MPKGQTLQNDPNHPNPGGAAQAQPDDELNLQDLVRVALSHLRFILGVTLLCAALALVYAFLWPPTFQASTTVKVTDSSQTPQGMLKELVPIGGDPIETFVEVCRADSVAIKVAEDLHLAGLKRYRDLTEQQLIETLQHQVQVSSVKKSNVMEIVVTSGDAKLAADIANDWAASFIAVNLELSHKGAISKRSFLEQQITAMKTKLDNPQLRLNEESKSDEVLYGQLLQNLQEAKLQENVDDAGIVVVDPAVVPERPISPKKARSLALALILGLALGLQSAFLMEKLRDRIKHEDVLKRVTLLPNYAIVPDFREDYPEGMSPPDPNERFSVKSLISNPVFTHAYYRESFKVLRTNLTFAQADRPLQALAVLSPGPEEGKTLVNANLAISLAQAGKRTILIDADLRKSSVRKIFGLKNGEDVGLPVVLTGQGRWQAMVKASGIENLDLLPNTVTPPNPAELLGSEAMKNLLAEIKGRYDFVVFDGAPILPVTDSVVLSTLLDGVVLMCRWDSTRSSEVQRALEHLRSVGAPVLGTLLNRVLVKKGLYGYGGYGNYGGYGKYTYGPEAQSDKKGKS